jgi:hypothetical protein
VRAGVSLSSKMGHGDKLIVIPPSWLPLLLCSYRRLTSCRLIKKNKKVSKVDFCAFSRHLHSRPIIRTLLRNTVPPLQQHNTSRPAVRRLVALFIPCPADVIRKKYCKRCCHFLKPRCCAPASSRALPERRTSRTR